MTHEPTETELREPVETPDDQNRNDSTSDDENEVSFPFDLVFVFEESKGSKEYAENLYSDLVHDGLFACKYVRPYRNGVNRIFIGIGASDRFLVGAVEHYHFTEERTEAREYSGISRIYAQNTRQRILLRYLKLRRYGGPHASIEWLQKSGILADYFLLHDPKQVENLRKGFSSYIFLPETKFISDMEEYFGEELAMYMAWLRTLILFSGPLCIVFAVFFAFEIHDKYSSWSMAAAGYFAPVYIQFFHEYWKRQEKRLAFDFGTLDMEETAEVREGYHGTSRLVQWTRSKKVRHEGEKNDTIKIKAGLFELPIQHTVPVQEMKKTYARTGDEANNALPAETDHGVNHDNHADDDDPFKVKVVEDLDYHSLPYPVMEKYYPNKRRWLIYSVSTPTALVFCAAVMVAIYAIDFIREVLSRATGELPMKYSVAISIINGVVIVFFNSIYPIITLKLVEWENHRTRDAFENSYIIKLFVFVFVNSYFPIYLQVFKLYIVNQDTLSNRDRQEQLQSVVVQIFSACVSTVFVSNIQDIAVPFILGPLLDRAKLFISWIRSGETTDAADEASPVESSPSMQFGEPEDANRQQKQHSEHKHTHGVFGHAFSKTESRHHVFEHQMQLAEPQAVTARFMGRIILFGFAIVFASLFPLGMAFVFLDAVLVTRVEIIRYMYLMRRMVARQVESIGGWRECIQFLIVVGAITNCLILALQTDSLNFWYGASGTWTSRLTIFIASEHIIMFLVFAVEYIIPDTSMDIMRIKALQRYMMMRDQHRLTYDPEELQMPSHILLKENILPSDPTNKISNLNCVVCNIELLPGTDLVRRLPCHHHIHDGCVEAFIRTGKPEGDTVTSRCPSCQYTVECDYFEDKTRYHEYSNIRYRMCDEFTFVAKNGDTLRRVMQADNGVLRSLCADFGLAASAFPPPGEAPHGKPPSQEKAERDVKDE